LVAGLAVPAPLPTLAVAAVLGGVQASLSEVLWTTTLQQQVPAAMLSRVSAYGWLGALVFTPLGYALAGPAAGWLGVATTLWVGAGWVVASTAAAAAVPDLRRLQRTGSRRRAGPDGGNEGPPEAEDGALAACWSRGTVPREQRTEKGNG
jgi:MFS family permease